MSDSSSLPPPSSSSLPPCEPVSKDPSGAFTATEGRSGIELSIPQKEEEKIPLTWREAWEASPGPRNGRESLLLFIKALFMGMANIIPGVSGGTIAFITGIYEDLLAAIASVDQRFVVRLLQGEGKAALATLHVRFLIPVALGVGISVVAGAHIIHYLFQHHAIPTWSFFFGLIVASGILIAVRVKGWTGRRILALLLGCGIAYGVINLIPVETPKTWWFVFFAGAIAILAMLLPGISGGYLLLLLNQYVYITGAIKDPWKIESLVVLLAFGAGTLIGLAASARAIQYLLARWHVATLCALTGFVFGSLPAIWPWKQTTALLVVHGKPKALRQINILPSESEKAYELRVQFAEKCVPAETKWQNDAELNYHLRFLEIIEDKGEALRFRAVGPPPRLGEAIVFAWVGLILVLVLEGWAAREGSSSEGKERETDES